MTCRAVCVRQPVWAKHACTCLGGARREASPMARRKLQSIHEDAPGVSAFVLSVRQQDPGRLKAAEQTRKGKSSIKENAARIVRRMSPLGI